MSINKLLEIHKFNLKNNFLKRQRNSNINWNKEGEMVLSNNYEQTYVLNESNNDTEEFVPRFSLKKNNNPIFAKFEPNKQLKFDKKLMVLAMEYGMILQIQYRGDEDSFVQGRTRVIYPMSLGTSSKGKPLLRAFHLKGYSLSSNGQTDKIWRLFRTDRILSMSFTGSFFRIAPEQYNANDKGMRGGIIKSVDIQEVRKNQKKLTQQGLIQSKKDIILDDKKGKVAVVDVLNTNSIIDLKQPWSNPNLEEDNKKLIRLTFLKNKANNTRIAILGALGKKGNTVKLSASGKFLGTFTVLRNTMGDGLNKPHLKQVHGESKYALMLFVNKRK